MAYNDYHSFRRYLESEQIRKEAIRQYRAAQELGNPDDNLAAEGVPVPIIYGRARIHNPPVIWWAYDHADFYKPSSSWPETTNHFIGVALALSLEVANNDLTKIWIGDKRVTFTGGSFRAAGAGADGGFARAAARFDNIHIFGGNGVGDANGFFAGTMRWYPGTAAQTANAYMSHVTAYRGTSYLVFENCEFGRSSTFAPIDCELEGYPDALNGATTRTIDGDANPAEVLYNLFTRTYGGLGLPTADFDATSFTAAAVTLHGELNSGVSAVINSLESAEDFVIEVLRMIDATIVQNPITGKQELKLIRNDYIVADLPSYTNSHLTEDGISDFQYMVPDGGYDRIKGVFELRAQDYKNATAVVQSPAITFGRSPNRPRTKKINLPFIRTAAAARLHLTRELRQSSTPIRRMRASFNRYFFDNKIGDVIKLTSSEYNLNNNVFRIASIPNWGSVEDSRIDVDLYEERPTADYGIGDLTPVDIVPLNSPDAITIQNTIEVPQWIGWRAEVLGLVPNRDWLRLFYFAKQPATDNIGFRPEVSEDAGVTYLADSTSIRLFAEDAQVETAYDRTVEPFDAATGLRIKNVSDITRLASATDTQIRTTGKNLILVGNEIMSYNSFTDLGGGVYRLNNVWRALLDTAPVDHAINERIWFIRDPDIFLGSLGSLGFDDTSAIKIRHETTTGLITLDTSGLTPEDLTLVRRTMLPYPADNVRFRQNPQPFGDTGLLNEYPGVAVAGLTEKWLVESEILPDFNRRHRKQTSIRRGDDADESPNESAADPGLGATTYDVDVDANGGGWINVGNSADDGTPFSLENVAFSTGAASEAIRVRTKRADSVADPLKVDRYSFQNPTVLARVAEYRQILVNPGFEDATDGRGWTVTAGTPTWTSGSTSLGLTGKHLRATAGTTTTIEQVRKVSGIAGKDLFCAFYARSFVAGAADVRVQVITETAAGTDLDTADSGTIKSAAITYWDRNILSIANVNASAVQVRVIVTVTSAVGPGQDGGVDGLELRVCGNVSAEQILNGGFNTDLTSWTPTNISRVTTSPTEGAGYAQSDNAAATCDMYQEPALPVGYTQGDVARLRFRRRDADDDTGEVILEARDAGGAVLRSATTGAENMGNTNWNERDLYLQIPAGTTKFRVWFKGVRVSPGFATAWDDVSLRLFDLT